MNHVNLYNNTISILAESKIDVDVNILEFACIVYTKRYNKNEAYCYLTEMKLAPKKKAVVLNLLACMKDMGHPVMPDYVDYANALRQAIKNASQNNNVDLKVENENENES